MTASILLRNLKSCLGRKANVQNVLTLLLLLGVILTYLNLSHLHDLILNHERENCPSHPNSKPENYIKKRK